MRTIQTCLLAFSLQFLTLNSVQAQLQYFQVSTNPTSLLFGVCKVEAELPIGQGWALEPQATWLGKGQRFWSKDYNSEGHRLGLVVKKYFDAVAPNQGFYGFAYYRSTNLNFTDFQEEGELADQRDFTRRRRTFGLGLGWTKVGKDQFYYGFALGLGRHGSNVKTYLDNGPAADVSQAEDETLFKTPIDVYGRVSMGFRIITADAWRIREQDYRDLLEEQAAQYREEVLKWHEEHGTTPSEDVELEARRYRHRVRNGNG